MVGRSTHMAADTVQPSRPRRFDYALAALLITAAAIYGSLVPLKFAPLDFHEAVERFRQVPYLTLGTGSRADWVANILLFVPISYFWLGFLTLDRGRRLGMAALVSMACAALSALLEFTQLWCPIRTVSQNDIVAETLGSVVGAGLWLAVGQQVNDWMRGFTAGSDNRASLTGLLEAYLIGFVIYSVLPLDLTIRPEELVHKLRDGKIAPLPFANFEASWQTAYDVFRDVVVFVPIGMLAVRWLDSRNHQATWWRCMLLCAVFAAVLELLQLVVYSRFSSSGDVILGVVGSAIGVAVMGRWTRDTKSAAQASSRQLPGAVAWCALGILYAGFLIVLFCAPFVPIQNREELRERLEIVWRVPFASLYWGTAFKVISHVLKKLFFFAPLGVMLVWATRRCGCRGWRWTLAATLWTAILILAVGIEVLQVLLPPHVPDITDVLLYSTGAFLGALGARHVRSRNISDQA